MPIQAEITINAPPHVVREVMLDFDKLSQWHTGDVFFSALKAPAGKNGSEVVKGEKITVSIPAMSFSPVMVSNTPEQFSWLGSLPFIYTGQHDFFFRPSPSDPNVTLFKQQESFSGLLAWAMGSDNPESSSSKKVLKGWTKFNEDLKRRSEEVYFK